MSHGLGQISQGLGQIRGGSAENCGSVGFFIQIVLQRNNIFRFFIRLFGNNLYICAQKNKE